MKIKNKIIIFVGIVVLVALAFLFIPQNSMDEITRINGADGANEDSELFPAWQFIELTDVRTGVKFTVNSFFGKPVLLESFAVWCPTCAKQQEEIKKLHEEIGDSVVSISLDTDPNEDAQRVLKFIEENDFGWYYAVSPVEMTQLLVDDFGNSIVNAPSAPVILICEDGSYKRLENGVKRVDELKGEIAEC